MQRIVIGAAGLWVLWVSGSLIFLLNFASHGERFTSKDFLIGKAAIKTEILAAVPEPEVTNIKMANTKARSLSNREDIKQLRRRVRSLENGR